MIWSDIWDAAITPILPASVKNLIIQVQGKQCFVMLYTGDKPTSYAFKPPEGFSCPDLRMYDYTWKVSGNEILINAVLDTDRVKKFAELRSHEERSTNGLKKAFDRFDEKYGHLLPKDNGGNGPHYSYLLSAVGEIHTLVDSTIQLWTKDEILIRETE